MALEADPRALRPLSKIELYSSTRHHMGIYRCVTVTCRHRRAPSTTPPLSSPSVILPALAAVVADQPMLRVGILGEDTSSAVFSHVSEIDLGNHVEFRARAAANQAEYDAWLADLQAWAHDQRFPDISIRPPWKIFVVSPGGELANSPEGAAFEDVMFAFHHSLADGSGAKLFHETLTKSLNSINPRTVTSTEPQSVYTYPDAPRLPEGQDDAINFTSSIPFTGSVVWEHLVPSWLKPAKVPPWAGKPISFSLPYKTRALPVDVSPEAVKALLRGCKTNSTTLTGLVHALVLTSLSQRLPAAEADFFVSTTPISLRPWLSPTVDPSLKNALRVLISSANHTHSAAVLSNIRDATAAANPSHDPSSLEKLVWQNASRVRAELSERIASLPADDTTSLLRYISDFFAFWRAKDGKPRDLTWEVSNIGVFKNAAAADDDDDPAAGAYRMERVQFTNGAMVTGSSIGVNVASVAGAELTATMSWQQGIVDDELVRGIAADLARWTTAYAQSGRFFR